MRQVAAVDGRVVDFALRAPHGRVHGARDNGSVGQDFLTLGCGWPAEPGE
ncbi:MAG: hypothetical protein H6702_15000 [Myxococcales bacterium]|nr:hypothetical protein [Myxococcales bacterium]